jgi:hypothetical protein
MANKQRDLAKERLWRNMLKGQSTSGLSVRGFCRREKLAENAFYAWRRIVAEHGAARNASMGRIEPYRGGQLPVRLAPGDRHA